MTSTVATAQKGSRNSPVVIVGESLGPQKSRMPFDGGCGRLLDLALREAGETKDAVFTTNVVDWHPPNNYRLTRQDIDSEIPRLKRELDSVSPKLVICLGKVAATTLRTLYPEARELCSPFTAPSRPIDNGPALLFALHPSAALRERNKLPEEERKRYERRYVSSLARALRWSFQSDSS
jgi:uracil-DNA glycosylase family 4